MSEGLSVEFIEITNEDVVVVYTPSEDIVSYSYRIIKDNVYGSSVLVSTNTSSDILLNSTGSYKIEITTTNVMGETSVITSGEYNIDKDPPIINIENKTYKIKSNGDINILDGVTASDAKDGDLTGNITTNINELDFTKEGIQEIKYSVSDKAGNTTNQTSYVTVVHDNTNLVILGQVGIFIGLIFIIVFLIEYIRSIKLEKRFSKYTINSSKNKSISLFDIIYNRYLDFINKFSNLLSKSNLLNNISKKYNKYINIDTDNNKSAIGFMARKIALGFAYIIIVIIVKLLNSSIANPLEILIAFILGYYTLDIIYIYKYNKYKKRIENDMLEAITIMNNSFKAGMSIVQAVDMVSKELVGPISIEFKKISMELAFGIDVEVAFKRFSNRVKIDEALYLTSSLSVLNKTGGNIIKVFDSIEKAMFSRKKLQDEMKALTSSSKLIMYVLTVVPIFFVLFIGFTNKDYFDPLFNNPVGIFLICIIILIYILYIYVVRKVMSIRM